MFFSTGLSQILKSLLRLEGLDAEDAADHIIDPSDGVVTYPFGHTFHRPQSSSAGEPKKQTTDTARKGTSKKICMTKKKYGSHNIPSNVKNFFKNKCQISKKRKNSFIKTGSASLAKNTWAKYASAYNARFLDSAKKEKSKTLGPFLKILLFVSSYGVKKCLI